jgi:hypothetical protein
MVAYHALRQIEQWALLHRADLEANWERMKAGQRLERSLLGRPFQLGGDVNDPGLS